MTDKSPWNPEISPELKQSLEALRDKHGKDSIDLDLDTETEDADLILNEIRKRRAQQNEHVIAFDDDYITWRRDCGEPDWQPRVANLINNVNEGIQDGTVLPLSIEVTHDAHRDPEHPIIHATYKLEVTIRSDERAEEMAKKKATMNFDTAMMVLGE